MKRSSPTGRNNSIPRPHFSMPATRRTTTQHCRQSTTEGAAMATTTAAREAAPVATTVATTTAQTSPLATTTTSVITDNHDDGKSSSSSSEFSSTRGGENNSCSTNNVTTGESSSSSSGNNTNKRKLPSTTTQTSTTTTTATATTTNTTNTNTTKKKRSRRRSTCRTSTVLPICSVTKFPPFSEMLYQLLVFRSKEGHCLVPTTTTTTMTPGDEGKDEEEDDDDDDAADFGEGRGGPQDRDRGRDPITMQPKVKASSYTPLLSAWVVHIRKAYMEFTGQKKTRRPRNGNNKSPKTTTPPTSKPPPSSTAHINYLTQENIDVLNSLDFVWSKKQYRLDQLWEEHYEQLKAFKAKHGHCNAVFNTPLGYWVQSQRDQYRIREKQQRHQQQLSVGEGAGNNGDGNGFVQMTNNTTGRPYIKQRASLSQERMDKLNEIGFTWRLITNTKVGWEERFAQLVEYRARFGNCNVPQHWKENVPLGRWVMKQRVEYNRRARGQKSQLRDDRIDRLDELGFDWVSPSYNKTAGAGGGSSKTKEAAGGTTTVGTLTTTLGGLLE